MPTSLRDRLEGLVAAWPVWLPALVALLLYLPVLHGELVWDDPLFLHHPLYRDPVDWAQALGSPFVLSPNYFRPLAVATFLLVRGAPWLHHLLNVLLHALNTALVAVLALVTLSPPRLPRAARAPLLAAERRMVLGAGLLYAVHPALVEGVAFIAGRFDLLVTTFLLLALLADVALAGRRWLRPLAVGVATLCAALSKEMAAAFLLVLPLWHLSYRRSDRGAGPTKVSEEPSDEAAPTSSGATPPQVAGARTDSSRSLVSVYLAAGAGLAAYLAIRYAVLGYLYLPETGSALETGSLWQHLLLVARSLAEYALLVVWPFTSLRPIHYSPLPLPMGGAFGWLVLAVSAVLLFELARWALRERRTGALVAAGVVALLPVLNILPLELGGGAFVAERFLLFPLALVALAAARLVARSRNLLPVLALWAVAAVALVQLTVPHWHSDGALWTWGLRRAPLSPLPYTNLSLVYTNRGNPTRGLALAEEALRLDPDAASAHNHRGLALFRLGRYAEAQAAFMRATDLEPQHALYWSNLAGALREQGRLGEAEAVLLEQALQLDPNLGMAHYNLGLVYLQADRPDLAVLAFTRALGLLPPAEVAGAQAALGRAREPERWLRLADLFLERGEPESVLQALLQAEQLGASALDVAVGRSAALIALEDYEQAESLLQAALLTAPEDARLYNNLGLIAQARGETAEARDLFTRATELAPEWPVPRQNLARLEP